ncbi:LacI family DNA-binding transcriptional regulator [uncultured Rhodoferax sp.]|uniref:LacI family DNA-binding transcriptional regulator n=1 Tax=uncultured Rhodoferax sp. TaxID=223188 RepID=UPI0025D49DA8|nr:LacI family DNA-binding transcriptional regulator [uncultured Rhodoferax sp.]
MKTKVTITAIAQAAGVSTATVDRVLNSRLPVREGTALRVIEAADQLGYHAVHLMRQRLPLRGGTRRLGFCLQKRSSPFYQRFAQALRDAVAQHTGGRGSVLIEFMDDLEPHAIGEQLLDLGRRCDALGVVALDHPHVNAAVAELHGAGRPCLALLTDLSAPERLGCVSIDNRQRGRTAAWAVRRLSRRDGTVGVFVGSHRYLGQETSEMAFRSALREQAPGLRVLDAQVNLEDEQMAYEATVGLLQRHPDLVGLYDSAGGGAVGIVRALREMRRGADVVLVCHELTQQHRLGLVDGVIDLVIQTPLRALTDTAVHLLLQALEPDRQPVHGQPHILPFEIYTSENV